jgi:hypothetical protein
MAVNELFNIVANGKKMGGILSDVKSQGDPGKFWLAYE